MPTFDLEGHSFFWMTQVMACRDRQLAQELRGEGLRVPEWRALASLHAKKSLSMSELSDLASIDRSTLTRTMDRMQKSGWVTRLSDSDDMRVTRLALTASGQRLFARVWPIVERLNIAACAGLPESALGMLRWTLEHMRQNLDAGLANQDSRAA
ncbi:MAG: MarR family transcriptional regulator [Betaproteobacteria bacterium]|nr:MarR family transcriptional regulator [Betaproteobacteria bacterium]